MDTKNHATATNEAVREIAYLQRRKADLLNAAGREVNAIEADLARKTESLRKAIAAKQIEAREIAEALAEYLVNTGDLCSRFSDALARRGCRVYPPAYKPIRTEWLLVPNPADRQAD